MGQSIKAKAKGARRTVDVSTKPARDVPPPDPDALLAELAKIRGYASPHTSRGTQGVIDRKDHKRSGER